MDGAPATTAPHPAPRNRLKGLCLLAVASFSLCSHHVICFVVHPTATACRRPSADTFIIASCNGYAALHATQGSIFQQKLASLSSTPFPVPSDTASSKMRRGQQPPPHQKHYNATSSSDWDGVFGEEDIISSLSPDPAELSSARQSPFPTMPSQLFTNLAVSQFELLSNSLTHTAIEGDDGGGDGAMTQQPASGTPKISSMVLYLPKENQLTGQLEFVPAVTYPKASSERIFIASESLLNSGGVHQPPSIPVNSGPMGTLPGFFSAKELIPSYPFVSSAASSSGIGEEQQEILTTVSPDSPISVSAVEEISARSPPDTENSSSARATPQLSVTLLSGYDTLGVLMVWPYQSNGIHNQWQWTPSDKLQLSRAAKSLALALSMDNDRTSTQLANEKFRVAMADSLHQVKSPLQALRTFGKLLQQQLAEEQMNERNGPSGRPVMERVPTNNAAEISRGQKQALKLANDMINQGERVIDLLEPMDALVQSTGGGKYLLRGDIKDSATNALALLQSNSNNHRQQKFQLPPSMPALGDFELERVYPQDILGPVVYASQAVSREKGINFDVIGLEPDNLDLPGVTVCSKYIQEAVSTILDNAIKYVRCRRKGKKGRPRIPQIRVSLLSNEPPLSPGATLYIEDNGPGIPSSERNKVFERGYRGELVQDAVPGSGLGLAIAQQMITLSGGMIEILDSDGPSKLDGTAVRIILFRDPE